MRTIQQVHLHWTVAGLIGLALITTEARGQDFFWTNMLGGAYNGAGNWAPAGPPGTTQSAGFALDATYTVSFTDDATMQNLFVRDGDVTFDLDRNTFIQRLELANEEDMNYSAIARLTGGGILDSRVRTYIGRYAGSDGRLYVGNGSVFNLLDTSISTRNLQVGPDGGYGEIHVFGGGEVNVGRRLVVHNGAITIDGEGSIVRVFENGHGTAGLQLANAGDATLTISNGGALIQSTGDDNAELVIGTTSGHEATATVTGAGSELINVNANTRGFTVARDSGRIGNLYILDGAFASGNRVGIGETANLGMWSARSNSGTGYVLVSGEGSQLQANDRFQVWGGSTLAIADGGQISAEDFQLRGDGAAVDPRLAELDITLGAHDDNYVMMVIDEEIRFHSDTLLTLRVDGNFEFNLDDIYRIVSFETLGEDLAEGYGRVLGGYGEGATVMDDSDTYAFRLSYGDDLAGHVTLTAIPEPGTFALIAIGLVTALGVYRRQRR